MNDHEAAVAALEAALQRFLKAYDQWRERGADSAGAQEALHEARAALEEARRRLAQAETTPPMS